MALIRIKHAAWIAKETRRVGAILMGELPRDGLPAADVLKLLKERTLEYLPSDYQEIANALVADGTIEIIP